MPDVNRKNMPLSSYFGVVVAGRATLNSERRLWASGHAGAAAGHGSLWELDLVGVVVRRAALRRASPWLGLRLGLGLGLGFGPPMFWLGLELGVGLPMLWLGLVLGLGLPML